MTPTTHFVGRKFSQQVWQYFPIVTNPQPAEIGKIMVPPDMEFRRFYLGWITWQIPDPQVRIVVDFRHAGNLVRSFDSTWDGGYEKESQIYYNVNSPGNVTAASAMFPAFEVFQRTAGTSNNWPYGLNTNPDSMVAGIDFEDANNLTVTPYQLLMQPFRMVGTFDTIALSIAIRARTSAPIQGGYFQAWLGCASDAQRL